MERDQHCKGEEPTQDRALMPVRTLPDGPDELVARLDKADAGVHSAKSLATERERVMLGWAS